MAMFQNDPVTQCLYRGYGGFSQGDDLREKEQFDPHLLAFTKANKGNAGFGNTDVIAL